MMEQLISDLNIIAKRSKNFSSILDKLSLIELVLQVSLDQGNSALIIILDCVRDGAVIKIYLLLAILS